MNFIIIKCMPVLFLRKKVSPLSHIKTKLFLNGGYVVVLNDATEGALASGAEKLLCVYAAIKANGLAARRALDLVVFLVIVTAAITVAAAIAIIAITVALVIPLVLVVVIVICTFSES